MQAVIGSKVIRRHHFLKQEMEHYGYIAEFSYCRKRIRVWWMYEHRHGWIHLDQVEVLTGLPDPT